VLIAFIAVLLGAATWGSFLFFERRRKRPGSHSGIREQTPPGWTDYNRYEMTFREKWFSFLLAFCVLFAIGYIFYRHAALSCMLAGLAALYPKRRAKELAEKRKEELTLQFRQALHALSSAVGAGKSLENAFREVVNDLKLLYPDPQTYIVSEFELINRQVENGTPIEKAVMDFALRSGVDDLIQFGNVLVTCKRSGGNLVSVIRRTADIIGDKLEIEQEISVMIAQKRFETKALTIAPIAVVAMLTFGSPDYMEPLYRGFGHMFMSVSLLLLAACYWWAKKMMNMKV